ncbi:MAG: ABC transporter permease [Bryobacterales bacterium]|nr:ABC transporter permease [Bryobacterales bacterium]
MRRIAALALKEFRQFWRDRLTRSLAIFLPLVMITLYGTALTTNIYNLRMAIEDQDQTVLSRRYVEAVAATGKFVFVPRPPGESTEEILRSSHARAVLRIPAHFEQDFMSGRPTQVQLLIDGTESNTALILRTINQAVALRFEPFSSVRSPRTAPVKLNIRFWYNPGLSDALFFGSGALGLVLILFPALLGALAAAREKELGTIAQAYASTLTAPEWIFGKAIPYILIGMAQLVICFVTGIYIFGYTIPDRPEVLLVGTAVYITAGVFYGMLVGNATGTQSAAIQGVQFGAFLISLLLSGFLMPVANMPVPMQYISAIIPARHYIALARDVLLRHGDWQTSMNPLLALGGLALFFFLANLGRMRRMQFS